jgi:hypothetical protein
MADIELHVHTCEGVEPKLIKIASDATVEQLVREIQAAGAAVGEPGEEIVLWVENEEVACRKGHKIHDHGIGHGNHIHCHRCNLVKVFVTHESHIKEKGFAPSMTIHKVQEWAVEAFGLRGREHDEALYLHGDLKTKLPEHAHVGSFAKFPRCELGLCFAHKETQSIEVAVVTTSGSWPLEGFESVPAHQLIKVELQRATKKLGLADTNGWIAKTGKLELNVEKSYLENGLKCKAEIDYGPREGGGGSE